MNPSFTAQRRVTECPASMVLPQTRSTSAASTKGTENHKAIELAITSKNYENLSPKLAAFLSSATRVETEVAYAIDVKARKVRRIGVGIERNYGPLEPYEIPGTIDLICYVDGKLRVVDFKSRTRVEDAATNLQIMAAVVAVSAETGEDEATGGLWYLNDDWTDFAEFTALDAAAYYAERVAMFDRVRKARDAYENGQVPEVHTGSWCQYCPAMHHCPAKTRLALAAIGQLTDIRQSIATMSPEQAGHAWEKVDEINALLKPIEEALKERVIGSGDEGIPIEGGTKRLVYREEKMNGYDFAAIGKVFADAGIDVPRKPGIKMVPRKLKVA